MAKNLDVILLFDIYGEMLTQKQQDFICYYYNDDLSLAEIAESTGISRQGVRDNIVRAENTLREVERKTGVVKRFEEMQLSISKIEEELRMLSSNLEGSNKVSAEEIISKLQELKG